MKGNTLQENTYQDLVTENVFLHAQVQRLEESLSQALSQIEWFKRQVFGKTSEKSYPAEISSLPLFADNAAEIVPTKPEPADEVVVKKRPPRGKTKDLGANTDSGLRFDDKVEIITKHILPEEVQTLSDNDYEVIDSEISDRLVSRQSRRVVLRRIFHKVKIKSTANNTNEGVVSLPRVILKAPVPKQVIERSYFSVSFLVDMMLDKILYHQPLYRQHQSLTREGFHLSRSVLTKNFIRACEILRRVVEAQRYSILAGNRVTMDETPMRVGVDSIKHKMHKGFVWPIYGELNEIVYHYHKSRSARVIVDLVGPDFKGTILSDGFPAYESYFKGIAETELGPEVTHATCWIHARRKFVKLEQAYPDVYNQALEHIGALYRIEESLSGKSLLEIEQTRSDSSSRIVEQYFNWLRSFSGKPEVAKSSDLRNALSYSIEREESMRVFLKDPSLALDTNHLEREIRPIAVGRKNWIFCWTEVGAECLCLAQSLVRTCLLQDVDPRTYLIDILQRLTLQRSEDDDVSDLIPRLWKDSFGENPIPCPCEAALLQKPA